MMQFIDQLNQTIRLEQKPSRIVSLVPSQTELLYDLGLENEVVGITKFCIYPDEWFRQKTRVGGTKDVDIEKVRALQPDLIIGNKEENTQSDIEALREIAPVWLSDVNTLAEALEMIQQIGLMTRTEVKSQVLLATIESEFGQLKREIKQEFTFLYFMWKDPYFTVGPNTFIHSIATLMGGKNVQKTPRYPEWKQEELIQPEVIFLSSEPYPFKESHMDYFREIYPNSEVILINGEYFSWYGSRLTATPNYLREVMKKIQDK